MPLESILDNYYSDGTPSQKRKKLSVSRPESQEICQEVYQEASNTGSNVEPSNQSTQQP